MVQALIELDENENRVLNIVKAKLGLNGKSEAIKVLIDYYIEIIMLIKIYCYLEMFL